MLFVRGLKLIFLVFLVTEPRVIVGEYAGCDGSIQTIDLSHMTSNGTIHSPGYPNNYGNNQNCQWLIKASPMERVLIYFTTFDLENCCSCDSVEIFDRSNSSSTRLSKRCGCSLPPPVYSNSSDIFMRFTSDFSASGRGFVAHYRALNSSSGCPSVVPGASAGVIYSPNFPWNYPTSTSCEWFITAPWQKMINLNFTRFNVETNNYDYVEVRNEYNSLIGKYSGAEIPSSITSSRSMRVRFYSDFSDVYSGFMAFYQTVPTPTPYPPTIHWHWTTNSWYWTTNSWYWTTNPWYWTTNPWYWTTKPPIYSPSAASTYACKPNYITSISIGSYDSSSISSSNGDYYYPTMSPRTSCTFQIDTTQGYILELSFDDMSISSCLSCSCGYVKVRDGSSSSAQLLGTYCNENYRGTVSSKGNHMFVEYYGKYSSDSFQATVRSKKGTPVNVAAIVVPIVAAIVVPIVVAIVLFSIIFVVIKCIKIRRSAEPAGSSGVNEVALQPLSHRIELPPTTQSQSSNAEFGTSLLPQIHPPNTGFASLATSQSSSHPYSDPFTMIAAPPPPYNDHSQDVTNMSMEDGTVQL